MKDTVLYMMVWGLLTSCVSYTTPEGAKFNSLGGQVAMTGSNWTFQSNHEKSFGDAASAFKHGIWGLGVVAPLGKEAGSVLQTKSNNSLSKAVNASDNAVIKAADDNALKALKSTNQLKELKVLNP